MRPGRWSDRTAMTLIEVVIGLLIIALLAAVMVPQVSQRQRDGQAAAIANNLAGIRTAILEYRKAIGRYPSQLAHLTTQPPAGASDLCARAMPFDFSVIWRGPYLQQVVGAGGIRVRDATILNTIRRNPATLAGGTLAELLIDVTNVDQDVANILEQNFDSAVNLAAGTVRWTSTGSGQGTLTLMMPVRGC